MNVNEDRRALEDDPFFKKLPSRKNNKEVNKTDNELGFKNRSQSSSLEEDEMVLPKKIENKIPSELKKALLKVNGLRLTLEKQIKVC